MDVREQVLQFINVELIGDREGGTIDGSTQLLGGLLDSFALLQVVAFLEDQWMVAIEPSDITKDWFGTVDGIERLIARKTSTG